MRSKWTEGLRIQDWLNGTTDNWNKPLTTGAHPGSGVDVDAIATYWQLHPELGEGPASYEMAFQAVKAATSTTAPAAQNGTGNMSIADNQPVDWFYLIKTVKVKAVDAGGTMLRLFNNPLSDMASAFAAWDNNHTAEITAFDLDSYTGRLKGLV